MPIRFRTGGCNLLETGASDQAAAADEAWSDWRSSSCVFSCVCSWLPVAMGLVPGNGWNVWLTFHDNGYDRYSLWTLQEGASEPDPLVAVATRTRWSCCCKGTLCRCRQRHDS